MANMSGEFTEQGFLDLVSDLPKEKGWATGEHIVEYMGFWYPTQVLKGLLFLQHHFHSEPTDIVLASYPKSGTTWLKALLVAITNGTQNSPLLTASSHELVPMLETYAAENPSDPRPRSANSLMHTHISYGSLPESIKSSGCKVVYVFRDPKDVLVSYWHFVKKLQGIHHMSLEDAFDRFCRGVSAFGPYWDHVLGYWKASLEFQGRVFFLKYEDLMKDPCFYTKTLSDFIGRPLGDEMVEKVVDFCSFEKLSKLEVNQSGRHGPHGRIENSIHFRKGQVGDSKNYFTAEMMAEIDEITKEKFKGFPQLIEKHFS